MSNFFRTAYYRKRDDTVDIIGKLNAYSTKDISTALLRFMESGQKKLTLDLSKVNLAYPSGVLPLITSLDRLREEGITIYVKLPRNNNTRRLFRSVNWAHFLAPKQFEKSESVHDRHLVTRRFEDPNQQKAVVDDFMDVVLRNMTVPRDIISGLEWSINEITDNVLNHSNTSFGGIVQASTYPKSQMIAFAVADSGRGILSSMREGYPSLRTDLEAIGEAIKAGVTRDKKFGQGNGLNGTMNVTSMTGGSFEITSGKGRFIVSQNETKKKHLKNAPYQGTVVCGQMRVTEDFSIIKALDFGNSQGHIPVDIIETLYEMDDADCLKLEMGKETTGFGTRRSGLQIRTKISNLLNAEPTYPLKIDWTGIPIISSSFADEVMGKLFLQLGAIAFSSRVRNVGMEEIVRILLDKAVAQRLTQSEDE